MMRRHISKRLQKAFEERLQIRMPQFVRAEDAEVPDTMRVFRSARQGGAIFLSLQWHRRRDAFTVELAWDAQGKYPALATIADPPAEPTPQARFRIAQLWEGSGTDHWWELNFPESLPKDAIEARVATAVDEALRQVQHHALPYVEAMGFHRV